MTTGIEWTDSVVTQRAVTLHQPWAQLVALGVKTIETRSWPTKYRGRLLIHAGLRRPDVRAVGRWWIHRADRWWTMHHEATPAENETLELGAVVASCTLTACVPMIKAVPIGQHPDEPDRVVQLVEGRAYLLDRWKGGGETVRDLTDEIPFGDFAPGRWAWILDDIEPCVPHSHARSPGPLEGASMIYARTTVSVPTGIRIAPPHGHGVRVPDPEVDHMGGERHAVVRLRVATLAIDGDKVEVQLQIDVPDIELVYHGEAGVVARFKS